MAKRARRHTQQQELMQSWGVRGVLALIFVGLFYGFASLAIDSGSILEYAAAIFCLWYAVHNAIRSFRLVLAR